MKSLGMAAFVGAVMATGSLLAMQDGKPAAAAAGSAAQRVGIYD